MDPRDMIKGHLTFDAGALRNHIQTGFLEMIHGEEPWGEVSAGASGVDGDWMEPSLSEAELDVGSEADPDVVSGERLDAGSELVSCRVSWAAGLVVLVTGSFL